MWRGHCGLLECNKFIPPKFQKEKGFYAQTLPKRKQTVPPPPRIESTVWWSLYYGCIAIRWLTYENGIPLVDFVQTVWLWNVFRTLFAFVYTGVLINYIFYAKQWLRLIFTSSMSLTNFQPGCATEYALAANRLSLRRTSKFKVEKQFCCLICRVVTSVVLQK